MTEQSLKDKTAKGLFWGGVSNGVQQLLNLFFGIFLARLLTPADYGMVGMLTIFTYIAGSLQESGFIAALINKKEIKHKDYNAVFWFSILTSICLYLILFFCAPFIALFFKKPELSPLARYLFLSFVISSWGTAQTAFMSKKMMIKEKAISSICALTISGIIGIIMAYSNMSYWGIATQSICYITIVTVSYWYFSPWRPNWNLDFSPLKEMFIFSSKLLITNIFTQINNNLFSVILGRYFSTTKVGYYNQANKWTNMGSSFITGMLNSVSQQVLVEVNNDKIRQRNVFRKILRFSAFISFPLMFGLALVSNELVIITITKKWSSCVVIMQILCIGGAFHPVQALFSHLLISKGRSNIHLWNTILLCLIQLLTILIVYPFGFICMISSFVFVNICWLIVWHHFVNQEISLNLIGVVKDIFPFAIISILTMTTTYWLTINITNIYYLFISKIIIAASIYLTIMKVANAEELKECIKYIIKK